MRSLPTSRIAAIVERLNPLLHIDPVLRLPPEITAQIFFYLDSQSLLTASTLSRSWRARALDSQLWRYLFAAEGWNANINQVWHFEDAQREREAEKQRERKSRARPADAVSDAESKSPKKRARESGGFISDDQDTHMVSADSNNEFPATQWSEQHGMVEADDDERMEDVINYDETSNSRLPLSSLSQTTATEPTLDPPVKPSLLLTEFEKSPRINWQYLFKQKRRLEGNWQSGRFTNFQLPHPSHPYEAHAECIYTIQYSGKHLVSGSRDKTLRRWNLDTQRLALPPLRGHEASVLCLQFDASPRQDVIISGGSDCHIIIWQFSTGKLLRKVEKAHSESVLNLRFNNKYLITCSKDKTIKVWNRESLLPTDDAYPKRIHNSASARYPQHIINVSGLDDIHRMDFKPLMEYSLLMTLHGHTAAVNAIQILDDQIVSASGDRHIKVWDVKTGTCQKTITGHQKGIACVQFDGRRIVSGSSDETVRIFDASSGAEVACLRGHAELVRTVQPCFGDIPGNRAEEEAEAREIDRRFLASTNGGTQTQNLTSEQWRNRNAGSRDVADIFAYGAKLPPGGGGSRWARIVSGSYDETIIIWKRDSKGKWIPAHQLNQWEAIMRAGGQPRFMPAQNVPQTGNRRPGQGNRAQRQANVQAVQQQHAVVHQAGATPPTAAQIPHPALNNVSTGRSRTASPVESTGSLAANVSSSSSTVSASSSRQAQQTPTSNPTPSQSNPQPIPHQGRTTTANTPFASSSATVTHPSTHVQQTQQIPLALARHLAQVHQLDNTQVQSATNQNAAATAATVQQAHHRPAGHHHHHHNHRGERHATSPANARVYKLQFDSRRIICCSQDPTIVGWDFANGDREIEIASEFFGEEG
jgi:F-box and WD-40 domain protein 1/11